MTVSALIGLVLAAQERVLLGLVPVYAFALISAIVTFWWVSRLIESDPPDDDSDEGGGGGGGGSPRHKPRPHGPFGDGPLPTEPVAPQTRSRGDVHEVRLPRRREREHAPHPVREPLGPRATHRQ